MIEIKNRKPYPVSLVIRSGRNPRRMTNLTIPGIGEGKNTFLLQDELVTEYIERAEKGGLISTKHISKSGAKR